MPRSESPPTLRTLGVIAAMLGQPVHRITYVLRTRPAIRPSALAGRTRLFDRQAVDAIREELALIDRRQRPEVHDAE